MLDSFPKSWFIVDCLHLNGLAEVFADAFAFNNLLVDLASCDVVVSGESGEEISLVVSEIQVHFYKM